MALTKLFGTMIQNATTFGLSLLSAADAATARGLLGISTSSPAPLNYLSGYTLSNNVTDATNDIDIAIGTARNSTNSVNIALASAITKRLDAAWVAGTNQGGRDTGSIADGTWHVFAIYDVTNNLTDVLFSLSATSPTLPTNYTVFRRIGSILRESGAIILFRQYGDLFKRVASITVRSSATPVTNTLISALVPTGIRVRPLFTSRLEMSATGSATQFMGDGDNTTANEIINFNNTAPIPSIQTITGHYLTNTSGQIRFTLDVSSGTVNNAVVGTAGWIDDRGK